MVCVVTEKPAQFPFNLLLLQSPPTGTETAALTRCQCFSGADTHSHAVKHWLFIQTNRARACSRDIMLNSEVGMGGRWCHSFTIKLEVFGYCWYHRKVRAGCDSAQSRGKTHTYLYLVRVTPPPKTKQKLNRIVKLSVQNIEGWKQNNFWLTKKYKCILSYNKLC